MSWMDHRPFLFVKLPLCYLNRENLLAGIFTVLEVCKRLGITQSLGKDIRQSALALFQIAARILCQRSRNYAANEWLPLVAAEELLHLDSFNEDSLYSNLDWLCENQEKIEKKLFQFRNKNNTEAKTIYLYDVTSSCLLYTSDAAD